MSILQFDHAGHLASAAAFIHGGIHHFNDQMFLGYTHGLFYPPLEDFVMAVLSGWGTWSVVDIYPFYLSVLLAGFFFSLAFVLQRIKSLEGIIFYSLAVLWLVNIDKVSLISLQGWALSDLLIVGLSNQFLSGIGFFILCAELIAPSKNWERKVIFWTLFSVLSHIVVGAVSFILMLLIYEQRKAFRKSIRAVFWVIGLSAFYTVPFLFYSRYATTSTIFFNQTKFYEWFAGLALGLAIFWRQKSWPVHLFAFFLLSLTTILPIFYGTFDEKFSFHYYRLAVVGVFVLVVTLVMDLEIEKKDKAQFWLSRGLLASFLLALVVETHFWIPDFNHNWSKPALLQDVAVSPLPGQGLGRFWVFGQMRGCDFGLDSLLMEKFPEFRSTKGLFWESSYTNPVQSSYLATLFHPPVVLDYLEEPNISCDLQKRMVDQYIHLFNVKSLIAGKEDVRSLRVDKGECFEEILTHGSNLYRFIPSGRIVIRDQVKGVFNISFKTPKTFTSRMTNEAVETLEPKFIQYPPAWGKFPYFGGVVNSFFAEAKDGYSTVSPFYALPGEQDGLEKLRAQFPEAEHLKFQRAIPLKNLDSGLYQFTLDAKPSWFFLRLAFQPGMKITNNRGEEVPFFKGFSGVVGLGSEVITVRFQRTWVMWGSYFLSTFSLILLCVAWLRLKKMVQWRL